jgi:hypothetical protein
MATPQFRRDDVRSKRAWHSIFNDGALPGRQPIPAPEERQHVSRKPVHWSQPPLSPPIQVLCPDWSGVIRLKIGEQARGLQLHEPVLTCHSVHVNAAEPDKLHN